MTHESLALKQIQSTICLIRGQRVILDRDLARPYGVPTKALKQAVRRNALRFPADFMFELDAKEFAAWRSQIVTSTADRKGLRYAPMAFIAKESNPLLGGAEAEGFGVGVGDEEPTPALRATPPERGLTGSHQTHMQYSGMNISTMRTLLATHAELAGKLEALEKRYDAQFRSVFEALRQLMTPPARPRKQIGFRVREKSAIYRTQRQPRKPHA